ncbi:MAG: type II toxin-antitoxin system VapC family toxin [Pseudomonadota bacterium]
MIYFDTSFLAPLILEEASSARVEAYIKRLPRTDLCVSHWVRVELASLLAREVRIGGLVEREALAAANQFEKMLADSYWIISPQAADYDLARQFILHFPTALRAGDAMHLALAKNHAATSVLTLDKGMLKAGKLLRLPVSHGIRVN